MSVNEFCTSVVTDMNCLIDELMSRTGRSNPSEIQSWQRSLPKVSEVLALVQEENPYFGKTHIYVGHLMLEYKLPMASSWCDVVLLGNNREEKANVLIIENKEWDTSQDKAGEIESFVKHKGHHVMHPSEQVRGYVEYCQRFHSAVLKNSATVSGCVFFSGRTPVVVYRDKPNKELVKEYPVFSRTDSDFKKTITQFVIDKLHQSNEKFANEFVNGIYKQDRNMVIQVSRALRERSLHSKPFVLLDKQREAYNLILNKLSTLSNDNRKHVFIVRGPYGSGKSALAANLWIDSAEKYSENGNIVFVTTSSSQKSNWIKIFADNANALSGGFMVQGANDFNPGLTPSKVKQLREAGFEMGTQDFEENLKVFSKSQKSIKVPDDNHYLSIVDEAHALINPVGHAIGFSSGWCLQAGPQAYHIIRASRISVFLLHEVQSYRDAETTTVENIRSFANKLGAVMHDAIDLGDMQFRCGGSVRYEKWVEFLFADSIMQVSDSPKTDVSFPKDEFYFKVVNDPGELDDNLKRKHSEGNTVRLASSYSVPWKSKGILNPHTLSQKDQDFHLTYVKKGKKLHWIRPWNYVADGDYSDFIQANPRSEMRRDPLAEVGCPYVLRGFDFDFIGLLWLKDLVRRGNEWKVNIEHVHESAFPSTLALARGRNGDTGPLLDKVIRAYKILLTRAQKGIFLYIQDEETKEYIRSLLDDRSTY